MSIIAPKIADIDSNIQFKRENGRLLVQNKYFIEEGSRKGVHFYKHDWWARILSLFNRAVSFRYEDIEGGFRTVYISTVSLKHF